MDTLPLCAIRFCPGRARPGLRPHLCDTHAHLVICPTCDDWTIRERDHCKTCRGRWFVPPESAEYAIRNGVRDRRRERHPRANDPKWPAWEHAWEPHQGKTTRQGHYPLADGHVFDPDEDGE